MSRFTEAEEAVLLELFAACSTLFTETYPYRNEQSMEKSLRRIDRATRKAIAVFEASQPTFGRGKG